jgi:hypothetical protein
MSTRKYPWFKHYNNASDGMSLDSLWAENDFEAIAFYWRILELVSQYESQERRGVIEINLSLISKKTGWKSQRLIRLLSKIAQRSLIDLETISEQSYRISIPKWLQFQENKKNPQAESEQSARPRRKKKEERRKNEKENGASAPNTSSFDIAKIPSSLATKLNKEAFELLRQIENEQLLNDWLEKYDLDSLATEINNAAKYIKDKKKKYKSISNFLGGTWFTGKYASIKIKSKPIEIPDPNNFKDAYPNSKF